jgi:GlpG protein
VLLPEDVEEAHFVDAPSTSTRFSREWAPYVCYPVLVDESSDEKWSGLLPDMFRYPVNGVLAVAALIASIHFWTGGSIDGLVVDHRAFVSEPWRLLSSALPHVDPFHFAFNLYWLFLFGKLVERRLGRVATAVTYTYLAATSSSAEYAMSGGGIGLSGVGYGLFGFLWVAVRTNSSWEGSLDQKTIRLFVGWFLLCILLTKLQVWNVGNFAHGAGALFGGLAAGSCLADADIRIRYRSGVLVGVLLVFLAATSARPWVNPDSHVDELSERAFAAMEEENYPEAVDLWQQALAIEESSWLASFNLAIAYDALDRDGDALRAYRRAYELQPEDIEVIEGLRDALSDLGQHAVDSSDHHRVIAVYEELDPVSGLTSSQWDNLGTAYRSLGRPAEAREAYEKALSLDPEKEEYYRRRIAGLRSGAIP